MSDIFILLGTETGGSGGQTQSASAWCQSSGSVGRRNPDLLPRGPPL